MGVRASGGNDKGDETATGAASTWAAEVAAVGGDGHV